MTDVSPWETPEESGFTLFIDYAGAGAKYRAKLSVQMDAAGLSVAFDGEASSDFHSNRIGLVVLHRPDDAGRAVSIGTCHGTVRNQRFPTEISPHQPFTDIKSMGWKRDGTAFSLEFRGETFETEDQRNWTDASFKTYGTPLSRPYPVAVTAGTSLHQSVRLIATASDTPLPELDAHPVIVAAVHDHAVATVPRLSTSASGFSTTIKPIPGLDALLVELSAADLETARLASIRAGQQALALGVPLDVRLVVSAPEQIPPLLGLLPLTNTVRLGAFDEASHMTEPTIWQALSAEANHRGFAGTLVAGARSHFTELNRASARIPLAAPTLVYSITPQMHATEVRHVVETLPMQRQTALNALRIGGGKPLYIGPVTLRARFNAVSTGNSGASTSMTTDPLQGEAFTAAWLLGSINELSLPGIQGISYFEASGPRGLVNEIESETPAGELFAQLAALHGSEILAVGDCPPGVVLYPVRVEDGIRLFAANLTAAALEIPVVFDDGSTRSLKLSAWSPTSCFIAASPTT